MGVTSRRTGVSSHSLAWGFRVSVLVALGVSFWVPGATGHAAGTEPGGGLHSDTLGSTWGFTEGPEPWGHFVPFLRLDSQVEAASTPSRPFSHFFPKCVRICSSLSEAGALPKDTAFLASRAGGTDTDPRSSTSLSCVPSPSSPHQGARAVATNML